MRLGLTGGIGSGKSTVAHMLVAGGAVLIDADAISRDVTAPGGTAIALITARFGPQAITPEGALRRDVMRQMIFDDPEAKKQLEAIIHPLVSSESARQAEIAYKAGGTLVVFDIPLLVESHRWRQQLDNILVVDCTEATQISRVMARDASSSGWTRDAVEKVIAQQATRAQRRAAADWVIYNDGLMLEALLADVKKMAERITL